MLTACFYATGIVHHEFVLERQTVNSKFCKEVTNRMITRIHFVRPEFQDSCSWDLLHDNALARTFGVVPEFLAKQGIPMLSCPLYLPDLAPADSFYFQN